MYWGYNVNAFTKFSEVFDLISENSLNILIDNEGECGWEEVREGVKKELNKVDDVMVFFGGEGLRTLYDSDE